MLQENNFRFSRRSGTGALVLLSLLLIMVTLWRLLPAYMAPVEDSRSAELQLSWERFRKENMAAVPPEEKYTGRTGGTSGPAAVAISLKPFDPNTATETELVSLGLPVRTARTLVKYRSKGGTFRKKEDLQKLYTLSKEDYARIAPYVQIAGREPAAGSKAYVAYAATAKPAVIDLNTADADILMALRGIGPGYSRRILNFRNALGGFVRVDQLQEVYGFPDSTYQQLKDRFVVNAGSVKRLNINTATEEELGKHPYIGRKAAAGIIKWRNEGKSFGELEQLRQVPLINDEKYRKIAPYLSTH